MKVLVVGSGGREHALAWKLSRSKKITELFCAPGNSGIKEVARLVDIKADDIDGLLDFAKKNKIDFTVVGPEAPLVKGIVDIFNKNGLKIFGPTKALAMLEGSKVFSKDTMRRFGVPTADYRVFSDAIEAKKYLKEKTAPVVVKADGLCAGKGVIVTKTIDEAIEAVDLMLVKKVFGPSGGRIIIEDCLEGEEASMLVFSDGETITPLASSQDHKRIFDNDMGPNTGGMGAYSPAPVVSDRIFNEIIKKVFEPVIHGLSREGMPYKGVLYAGVMVTEKGPMVLEFNVRFGDPETQAVIPRLKSDLLEALLACADKALGKIKIEWSDQSCLAVVAASKGYPGDYEKDKEVLGLEDAAKIKDTVVFHAGAVSRNGKVFTSGGRVLAVTGLGKDIRSAKEAAYMALEKIRFEGMQYRTDIGNRAIERIA